MRRKIYKELIKPFINYSCSRELKSRLNYLTLQNYNEIQQKGGYKKIKTFKYMNYTFKTIKTGDKDEVLFMIYKNNRCFLLKIDLENNGLAILDSFGNDPKDGGGTIMMNFLLNYIKTYLPDIKRIELTDNSFILCNKEKISLSGLYTLISGKTWYGKFGFVPIDKNTKKHYKNNINIIDKITVSDVWNELEDIFIKYNFENNNNLLKNVLKEIFKKDCKYYEKIWKILSNKYDIYLMYGKDFVLYI